MRALRGIARSTRVRAIALRSATAAYALWSIASAAATLSIEITDARFKPLGDAVVYLVPVAGKAALKSGPKAIIDQINKEFVPIVSVVQTGTSVKFPNKDNIRHQIYSFSPAKTFQIKLYSGEPSDPVVFDKPGIIILGCNIHDSMVAYVVVVDTPFHALTGADGHARIEGVPVGDYVVHFWHYRQPDQQAPATRLLTLAGDATFKAPIAIPPTS